MAYRRRRSSGGGLAGALSTLYASQNAQRGAAMTAESRIEAANIGAQGAMDRAVLGSETQLATAKMRLQGQLEKAAMDQDYKRSYLSFLKDKLSTQEKREWAKLIDLAEYRKGQLKIGAWGKQNQEQYNKILAFGKEEMARHNKKQEILDFDRIQVSAYDAETRRGEYGIHKAKAEVEIPGIKAQTALTAARAQALPGESAARIGQAQANADWTKRRPEFAEARMGADLKKTQIQEQGKQGRFEVGQAGITQRATASQLARSQGNYFQMYERFVNTLSRDPAATQPLVDSYLKDKIRSGELDDVIGEDAVQEILQKLEENPNAVIPWDGYGIDQTEVISNIAIEFLESKGFAPMLNEKGGAISPADAYQNVFSRRKK